MSDDSSHVLVWLCGVLVGLIFGIWLTVSGEHARAIDAHVGHYVMDPGSGDTTFTWGPAPAAPTPVPSHP